MTKTRAPYPAEFRQQIIELVHAGRTPAELSREFGCTAQSIINWVGQAAADSGHARPGRRRHPPPRVCSSHCCERAGTLLRRSCS